LTSITSSLKLTVLSEGERRMGIQERRERERDQTRAKIMNAARELFARDGYDAVSMRRIADAIEYSPTAIYVHFKDKEALFAELCREDFGKLAEVFNALARIKDPIERIMGIGREYIRFALEHPNHYRLMFMTPHTHEKKEAMEHKGNPDEDAYGFLRQTVEQAAAAGRLWPEFADVDLATQTLWSVAHGIASLQITAGNDPWVDWRPIDVRARAGLGAVLRGMLAHPDQLQHAHKKRKAGAR
jgi:AcrR family transcriptional regulator